MTPTEPGYYWATNHNGGREVVCVRPGAKGTPMFVIVAGWSGEESLNNFTDYSERLAETPSALPVVKLIRPGTMVHIGHGVVKTPAQVLRATISGSNRPLYEVAWWDGRHRHEQWLFECEIEQVEPDELEIQFD